MVLFDEPFLEKYVNENGGATGGRTAAKTTSKIIERVAPILGIEKENIAEDFLVNVKRKGLNFASF